MAGRDTPLDADARVIDCPDKQAAISWPLPVDAKLDRLLEAARDAGERTSRREILAALVAGAEFTGDQLGEALRAYRRSHVRDLLDVPKGGTVIPIRRHAPGPRTS